MGELASETAAITALLQAWAAGVRARDIEASPGIMRRPF